MSKFDQLFATAAPLIADGEHQRDQPPREGGRWPISVVLRPPPDTALSRRLDDVTAEAADLAGSNHWHTGQVASAHLTVRALETYRSHMDRSEPAVQRYRSALERAAAATGPAQFQVTGLTLTPGSVMACAVPLNAQADLFKDRLATELGPDAWFELPYGRRDIWYLNLIHFTTDIAKPEALINWVAAHRTANLGQATIPTAELIRFRHAPTPPRPHMHPEALSQARLSAPTGSGTANLTR